MNKNTTTKKVDKTPTEQKHVVEQTQLENIAAENPTPTITIATKKTVAKKAAPKKISKRPPKAQRNMRGATLMAKLWAKMVDDKITPNQLAEEHLEMSYSYLMMLGRGEASVNELKVNQYRKMAAFLGIPTMQVLLLAEAVDTAEFFYQGDLAERINLVYEKMKKDPVYMGFAPSEQEWNSISLNLKLSMCVFYENCSQSKILNVAELIQLEASEKSY